MSVPVFPPTLRPLAHLAPNRDRPTFLRTPIAVVVDEQEWTTRALEAILGDAGFAVVQASSRREATDVLRRTRPDTVFVGLGLEGGQGMAVYAKWVEDGLLDFSVPVVALASVRPDRDTRLKALGAGAWDVLTLPLDADELVLRLGTAVRAKQAADQIREESLVDAATGLYNARGVLQKLSELRSAASRNRGPLACIVVGRRAGSEPPNTGDLDPAHDPRDTIGLRVRSDHSDAVTRIWRATRRSDAKGALPGARFVVIAPNTDLEGARRLAARILDDAPESQEEGLVAGLFVADDLGSSPVTASDFLARASEALRETQLQVDRPRILGYEPSAN